MCSILSKFVGDMVNIDSESQVGYLGVGVGVGITFGVAIGVGAGVAADSGEGVGVWVDVGVGVLVGVTVGIEDGGGAGVSSEIAIGGDVGIGRGINVGDEVGSGIGVKVAVRVGVRANGGVIIGSGCVQDTNNTAPNAKRTSQLDLRLMIPIVAFVLWPTSPRIYRGRKLSNLGSSNTCGWPGFDVSKEALLSSRKLTGVSAPIGALVLSGSVKQHLPFHYRSNSAKFD